MRVLVIAPPGSGVTIKARELARSLPGMTPEVQAMYRASHLTDPDPRQAPFRAPHYTCSSLALVGSELRSPMGPRVWLFGEAQLATGGVLLLDELPEFRRGTLQCLAEELASPGPYPAAPAVIIGTASPCPCGHRGDTRRTARRCICSVDAIARHARRVAEYAAILGMAMVEIEAGVGVKLAA